MEWTYNAEDYHQVFNHTHESKSHGPLRLHVSHWKAAVKSDFLTTLHTNMIWMAFVMGIVYH